MGLFSFLSSKATVADFYKLQQQLIDIYKPADGDSEWMLEAKEKFTKGKVDSIARMIEEDLIKHVEKSMLEREVEDAKSSLAEAYQSNRTLIESRLKALESSRLTKEALLNIVNLSNPEASLDEEDEASLDNYQEMLEVAEAQIVKSMAALKKLGYSGQV